MSEPRDNDPDLNETLRPYMKRWIDPMVDGLAEPRIVASGVVVAWTWLLFPVTAIFYGTPVLYPLEIVPTQYVDWMLANPTISRDSNPAPWQASASTAEPTLCPVV